jgi:hypothetical protein
VTHEQEEHVRRVLGSLPPEDPTPPAVATRLDATLADLVAERRPDIADDELAARRRRRRLATGLVAAASVAVIGIGLGTVAQLGGDGESALPGQAASEAGGDAAAREVAPREATEGGATGDLPDGVRYLAGGREEVSSATLERDVARVAALAPVATSGEGLSTDRLAPSGRRSGLAALAPCGVPAAAAGDLVAPVRLDGEPATLVLRREVDGAREAQIYSCDDPGALLASTTLPRR